MHARDSSHTNSLSIFVDRVCKTLYHELFVELQCTSWFCKLVQLYFFLRSTLTLPTFGWRDYFAILHITV